MTDTILTHEAKAAIRNYMLLLITVPAIILSVVMFVMGYLVNEGATGKAYNKAYETASSNMLELMQQASVAANDAEQATAEIDLLRRQLVVTAAEAKKIRDGLSTAETFQKSENLTQDLVNSLANREDFKQSLVSLTHKQLALIEQKIDAVNNRLDNIRLTVVSTSKSSEFSCGETQNTGKNNLVVMSGSRDGTGCGVHNINYYKTLGLSIPDQ